jgi:hypothetical protein
MWIRIPKDVEPMSWSRMSATTSGKETCRDLGRTEVLITEQEVVFATAAAVAPRLENIGRRFAAMLRRARRHGTRNG